MRWPLFCKKSSGARESFTPREVALPALLFTGLLINTAIFASFCLLLRALGRQLFAYRERGGLVDGMSVHVGTQGGLHVWKRFSLNFKAVCEKQERGLFNRDGVHVQYTHTGCMCAYVCVCDVYVVLCVCM